MFSLPTMPGNVCDTGAFLLFKAGYNAMEGRALLRRLRAWLVSNYTEYHDLFEVSVISLLANLGYGVLNVSAIQPYARQVGWAGQLGWIYGTYIVAEALARSPMGALGDRIGRRSLFIAAAAVGAVTSFLWTVIPVLWIILIVHALDGIMFAAFYTATIVTMTEAVGEDKRTTAMTVFLITLMAGLSIGPVIGGYANELTHSTLTSFYVTAAVFLVALMTADFFFPARIRETERKAKVGIANLPILAGIWPVVKTVPKFFLLSIFIFFPPGLIIPIVKLFTMAEFGFSEGEFGLAFVSGATAVGIVSIGLSWLTKRINVSRTIQAGLALSAVGTYLVVFVHSLWPDLIFAALLGLGFVLSISAWQALNTEQADPEVRGLIVGVMGLGQGLGLITGVVLGSYLYTSVPINLPGIHLNAHYTPFFVMALGLTVAAVLAFFFLKGETERRVRVEDIIKNVRISPEQDS